MKLTSTDIFAPDGKPLRARGERPKVGPVMHKDEFEPLLRWTCQQPPVSQDLHFGHLVALLITSRGLWGVEKLRRLVHGEFGTEVRQAIMKSLEGGVAWAVSAHDGEDRSYNRIPVARLCLSDSGRMLRLAVLLEAGKNSATTAEERSDWLDVLSGSKMPPNSEMPRDILLHVNDLTHAGSAFRTGDPSSSTLPSHDAVETAIRLAVETNPKRPSIDLLFRLGGPMAALVSAEIVRQSNGSDVFNGSHASTAVAQVARHQGSRCKQVSL
ncbi:hypothetical protein [Paucibacter soli]|uniref:hypothetical protein n=1 Tax=Paucibacter soli TaxID=3133433 RepID=UPI0030A21E34